MEKPAKQLGAIQKKAQEEVVPKRVRTLRFSLLQSYIAIISILFVILAVLARFIPYFTLDLAITRLIQEINLGWFYNLMTFISWFGYGPQVIGVILVIGVIVFLLGLRWEAIMIEVVGFTATLMSVIIKLLVHRVRPTTDLVHVFKHVGEFSFPSGHVILYTALFGFLIFVTYALMKKSLLRDAMLVIYSLFILLIAPSRIYLGAHWASDVIGAYMFGSLWLLFMIKLYRMGKKHTIISQKTAE
jgi:undecaprenyl-diphosphatase